MILSAVDMNATAAVDLILTAFRSAFGSEMLLGIFAFIVVAYLIIVSRMEKAGLAFVLISITGVLAATGAIPQFVYVIALMLGAIVVGWAIGWLGA